MGFTLTTDDKGCTVYKKEHNGKFGTWCTYCTKASTKDKDGNWESVFIDLKFKKDANVNNKAKIKIKNSFPVDFRKVTLKDGKEITVFKWMIMDFDVLEQGEAPADTSQDTSWMDTIGDDDNVPFE